MASAKNMAVLTLNIITLYFAAKTKGITLCTGSTSSKSTILIRVMQNILKDLRMKTTRCSTARNYYGIWRKFNQFLIKLDDRPFTWERRVALYGAYLVSKGTQSSTIKSYFSAIKRILFDGINYQFSDNNMLLASIAKACHFKNDKVQTRLPITKNLLEQILFEVEQMFHTQVYLSILFKAVFTISFMGYLESVKSPNSIIPPKLRTSTLV